MPLGIDPKVDFAFKRMLGSPEHPAVTIHFLNAVLQLPDPVTAVEILNPIQEKDHFGDKRSVRDVLASDQYGRKFNIEMQTTVPQALRERLTYYSCCNYTEQLFEGDNYDELRPVISICVLDEILFAEPTPYHLSFRLRCDQANITFSNALEFHTLELPKFNLSSHNKGGLPPVDAWASLLKYAPDMESNELAKLLVDPPLREALGILLMIAKTPDERRQYEDRLKAERDERWRRNAAIKEGQQEGLKEGLKEGLEKGQLIGQMKLLQGFLGEAIAVEEEMMAKSVAELTSLRDQLQSRFSSRSK